MTPGLPASDFDEDFLVHKNCSEWWYATGILEGKEDEKYGFFFTLTKIKMGGITYYSLLHSLTDLKTGKHYYSQSPAYTSKNIEMNAQRVGKAGEGYIEFSANEFAAFGQQKLRIFADNYTLEVDMVAQKKPVWHCDQGELVMGNYDDPTAKTFYFSLTNMLAKATLKIDGEVKELTGKSWFDKQGGPYNPGERRSAWEWFSLRFFDNTEAMLFAFPQMNYYDGTYIDQDGNYRRMNDYLLNCTETIEQGNKKFSSKWRTTINGKKYTIIPYVDGMFNYSFYEELCRVIDDQGQLVGLAFAEILPGVRNRNGKDTKSAMFHQQ